MRPRKKMNEQIKQLAQQAGMYVDLKGEPWPKWMGAEECELAYAKFAELIVQECIDINKQELAFNAFERLMNKYKDHFGVE
jgi:hypothetical protein